ncbi:MAG: hypothetical protein LBC19_12030 [Tannerella sp.]|nr:hypothetical protein [Tannerella sp.]
METRVFKPSTRVGKPAKPAFDATNSKHLHDAGETNADCRPSERNGQSYNESDGRFALLYR